MGVVSTLVVRSSREGRVWRSGNEPGDTGPRSGADDETTRRVVESDGQEDQLAVGGGDHWRDATHDAAGRERLEEHGYDGLGDWRKGKPSQRRVPLVVCEPVLELYQARYYDFNGKHFHEKLGEEQGMALSYTWVKQALQGAGLVPRRQKRTPYRKRRPRKEMPGIMQHIDGSKLTKTSGKSHCSLYQVIYKASA